MADEDAHRRICFLAHSVDQGFDADLARGGDAETLDLRQQRRDEILEQTEPKNAFRSRYSHCLEPQRGRRQPGSKECRVQLTPHARLGALQTHGVRPQRLH